MYNIFQKVIDKLEGIPSSEVDATEEIIPRIYKRCVDLGIHDGTVMVSGSISLDALSHICDNLNRMYPFQDCPLVFTAYECCLRSVETIKNVKDMAGVVIVEQCNYSEESVLTEQIDFYGTMSKAVIGVILIP